MSPFSLIVMAASPSHAFSSDLRTRDRGKRPQEEARLPVLLVKKAQGDPSADGSRMADPGRDDMTGGSAGAEECFPQLLTLYFIIKTFDVPV